MPPLSVWPCGTPCRAQGGSDLHLVRPNTNHLAAPSRRRAPWDVVPPWAKVSGSQTDLLTPCYDGRAEIIPFWYVEEEEEEEEEEEGVHVMDDSLGSVV
jgi:hypothetical protein